MAQVFGLELQNQHFESLTLYHTEWQHITLRPARYSWAIVAKETIKKSSYYIKSGVDVRAHWLTDTVMKHALLGVDISGSHISLTWSIHVLQSCWMRNWNWFLKDVIKIQAMTSAAPVFRYNYRNVIQTKAGANNPQQKTTRPHGAALPLAIFVREGNFNFFFSNEHNNFSLCFTLSSVLCHDKLIKKKKKINF